MKIDAIALQSAIDRLPKKDNRFRVGDYYRVTMRPAFNHTGRINPPNMPVSFPHATFQLLPVSGGASWHLIEWPEEEKE